VKHDLSGKNARVSWGLDLVGRSGNVEWTVVEGAVAEWLIVPFWARKQLEKIAGRFAEDYCTGLRGSGIARRGLHLRVEDNRL
jgi:hypothetical protein